MLSLRAPATCAEYAEYLGMGRFGTGERERAEEGDGVSEVLSKGDKYKASPT